jgi:hypothetical protein
VCMCVYECVCDFVRGGSFGRGPAQLTCWGREAVLPMEPREDREESCRESPAPSPDPRELEPKLSRKDPFSLFGDSRLTAHIWPASGSGEGSLRGGRGGKRGGGREERRGGR